MHMEIHEEAMKMHMMTQGTNDPLKRKREMVYNMKSRTT